MARIKPQALLLQSKKKKAPARVSIGLVSHKCGPVPQLENSNSPFARWPHVYADIPKLMAVRSRAPPLNDPQSFEEGAVFAGINRFDLPSHAVLNTSKGLVTVELYKDASPRTVDKFIDLCQKDYFRGMLFRRVIKNYVIQGGNSNHVGSAEDWTFVGKLLLDTSPKHEAFMLGTSKVARDDQGFEIYITTAPIPDLNDKLIVFGRVIKGEDIVQEIEEVDTDEHYQPKSPIGIINIVLKRKI